MTRDTDPIQFCGVCPLILGDGRAPDPGTNLQRCIPSTMNWTTVSGFLTSMILVCSILVVGATWSEIGRRFSTCRLPIKRIGRMSLVESEVGRGGSVFGGQRLRDARTELIATAVWNAWTTRCGSAKSQVDGRGVNG